MTDYQNELVMEHLDLVNWVIRTRISVPNRPLLTYDDFYAIGCEAICRAALKYQADSGEFAPFACRYIYNAIIDHCRAMNYRLQRSVDAGFEEGEVLFDLLAHTTVDFEAEVTDDSASEESQDIEPLVFGFVAQIRNALFCQRIVAPVPADIVRFESLQPFGRNQAGGEKRVRGLDRFIAVIDRDNHGLEPPHFV